MRQAVASAQTGHQTDRAVGKNWRVEEAYFEVKDQWKYLDRAVDTPSTSASVLMAPTHLFANSFISCPSPL